MAAAPRPNPSQDGGDVGEVAQDGGLLDDGRHDDGVAGVEHQIVEVAIGEERALGEAALLVADHRPVGPQHELTTLIGNAVGPPARRR